MMGKRFYKHVNTETFLSILIEVLASLNGGRMPNQPKTGKK